MLALFYSWIHQVFSNFGNCTSKIVFYKFTVILLVLAQDLREVFSGTQCKLDHPLTFSIIAFYFCLFCACTRTCVYMCVHTCTMTSCGGQRSMCGSWVSPSIMKVQRLNSDPQAWWWGKSFCRPLANILQYFPQFIILLVFWFIYLSKTSPPQPSLS